MSRISRYFVGEILGPLALGFMVYTFILMVRVLFISAEMIIRRGVPASTVGELLLLNLPNIVVLTLPMALLFGILTAVGRLSSDSELVALRSSGVSLLQLYRPVFALSILLTLVNIFLMSYWLPWGNASLQQLKLEILSKSVSRQVQPRVFYEEWQNKVLYVFDVDPATERWLGVFLAQSLASGELEVTTAEWGEVRLDASGERLALRLGNAETHRVNPAQPDRYDRQKVADGDTILEDRFTSTQRAKISAAKGVRELTLPELLEKVREVGVPEEIRNVAQVEVHKKFSIPFAAVVFGLCALPMGFTNRRGGKTSGFVISIGVILVYYILINNGEEAARFGKLPPALAMWLPNLLLGGLGIYLLIRRNQEKPLLPSGIDRWIRGSLWSWFARHLAGLRREGPLSPSPTRNEEPTGTGQLRLRISRPRLTFPNVLDRYVLRVFGGVFAIVLLSGITLYVVSDLTQKVDEIIRFQVPRGVVLAYYSYLSLQIFYDLAPILVLVTTLIAFSLLSRTNEVTAAKALGVSLYRLAVPVVAAAVLLSFFATALQVAVLPATNQEAQRLDDQIAGREAPRTYSRPDRWLYGKDGYIYNFLHYDKSTRSLQRFQAFELGEDRKLRSRLYAAEARFDPTLHNHRGGWLVADGWIQRFDLPLGSRGKEFVRFAGSAEVDCRESPEFFVAETRRPEQMGYEELDLYIDDLRASGKAVPELEVELYRKVAFPTNCLVMALVALPFAFRLGRQGALYGIGVSIALGFLFFGILALFSALGQANVLPPLVAVWAPSAVFATFAIYLFLGIRT